MFIDNDKERKKYLITNAKQFADSLFPISKADGIALCDYSVCFPVTTKADCKGLAVQRLIRILPCQSHSFSIAQSFWDAQLAFGCFTSLSAEIFNGIQEHLSTQTTSIHLDLKILEKKNFFYPNKPTLPNTTINLLGKLKKINALWKGFSWQ